MTATLAAYAKQWGCAIAGRMQVEGAKDTSDAEIERTLSPCVCGPRLVEVAKYMRDAGTLDIDALIAAS